MTIQRRLADALPVNQDVVTNQAAAGVLANDIELDTNDTKVVTKLNSTDLNGGSNSLTVTSSKGATFTLNEDGSFSYDPTASTGLKALDPGDSVEDQFTYTMVILMGRRLRRRSPLPLTVLMIRPLLRTMPMPRGKRRLFRWLCRSSWK